MVMWRQCRRQAALLVFVLVAGLPVLLGVSGGVAEASPVGTITDWGPGISKPRGIAAGPDGNLWFADYQANAIGRVTPSGTITLFRSTIISLPIEIVAGSDGALWFTNSLGYSLGRITTSGSVSLVAHVVARGMLLGPDGNVWFGSGTQVGRVTPAGVVTLFGDPSFQSPTPRIVGPDGKLWIDTGLDQVVKMATDGTVTPALDEGADRMIVGPDGALWYTSQHDFGYGPQPSFVRIDANGTVLSYIEIGIANYGDYVTDLLLGPDGFVWFRTAYSGSSFWRYEGNDTWTPLYLNSASIMDRAIGPDGNLWYTDFNNVIGRLTPAGVVTTFATSRVDKPMGIVQGPDGNMWFVNNGNSSIGRVTPAGVYANFTAPGISDPKDITAGPDGALWFTNANGHSIGRITTGGAVTSFTTTGIGFPNGITVGPDGNLWFASSGQTPAIGRITTAGVIDLFTSSALVVPRNIVAGSDGNLWFTNQTYTAASIGRITTSGVIDTFTDPALKTPQDITAGSDGNLWFTDIAAKVIGRITPSGTFAIFSGANIVSPKGIVAGPDGNLWFTNTGPFSIGRITPAGVTTKFTNPFLKWPEAIAAGPGGQLYFTVQQGNNIARITAVTTPTITSLGPTSGSIAGGTSVTITGTNLRSTSSVRFGSTPASFTVIDDSHVIATAPVHAAGLVNVWVTNAAGTTTNTSASWFTYKATRPAVTAVTPNAGPVAGGSSVVITGSGFTGTTMVKFGTTATATFSVVNDTTINVTTPAHAAALVNVFVTTPGGTSAAVSADWYRYQ